MKIFIPVVLLILLVSWTYLNIGKQDGNWIALWNGKDLTGWHTFLGTPYQSKEDDTGNKIIPFGIDHDPLQVIKVVDTDQGKAIRISGDQALTISQCSLSPLWLSDQFKKTKPI